MPALERSPARIIRVSTIGRFIVRADHLDRLSGFQIVKRKIDRGAAIVTRALRWICDKDLLVVRRRVPKYFRDVPRTITIVNKQSITRRLQLAIDAHESFRRSALQESAGLGIEDRAEEIVCCSVTDVEFDRRIEFG